MSNKITNEDIEKANVKLKPIFGIKPGIYLTIIYSIIVILALFLILILPGLKNNGVSLSVETVPSGAAVYVDNIYRGTSPVTFFTKKGKRQFRIEKKYFETSKFTDNIGGRIIGSLLFPKKYSVSKNIKLNDTEGFLSQRFTELSSFALIEDYYDHYQMPHLISKTVSEFVEGSTDNTNRPLYNFLYAMRVNLGSPEMVEDYIRAVKLMTSANLIKNKSEVSDMKVLFDFFKDENNTKGLMLSILKAYSKGDQKAIMSTLSSFVDINSELKTLINNYQNEKIINRPVLNGKKIAVNNLNFIGVSSGSFFTGSNLPDSTEKLLEDISLSSFPHTEKVNVFFILDREITRGEYSLFLKENPSWKPENIKYLLENKLANENYLAFQDMTFKTKPIANISWYAASAYCQWLESKLPQNISSYSVRLPSEAEWEAAAIINAAQNVNCVFKNSGVDSALPADFSREGRAGLYDIQGNLWEWNANWYFPTDTENGQYGLRDERLKGAEKSVRGGSWANAKSDISIYTRGSQDPSWCTPFIGFRPVLVKR